MAMFWSRQKEAPPEWNPTFEPIMKVLLAKKGIKTKMASVVGKKKVAYFRGKDFKTFMLENPTILKKKCAAALSSALPPNGAPPESENEVEAIGNELIAKQFCYKAVYTPINATSETESGRKKRWPDRLGRHKSQKFDCDGFYVVTYQNPNSMQHFMLALIIFGVLSACLFPVWPMWIKVGTWYVLVLLLTLYFGLLIIRMVIFTLFWIVGFDFWIFPNINDETIGFLDTFKPFYSWDRRNDDSLMLLCRFGGLAITAVAVQQIAESNSLHDIKDFVEASYVDVLDWGVDKLTNALPGSEKQALPNIDAFANDSAWDDDGANASLFGSDGLSVDDLDVDVQEAAP